MPNKNIIYLTIAFAILFFGFTAIQQYTTSYFSEIGNENGGFIVLIIIYSSFLISTISASFVIKKISLKKSMLISSFFYIAYGASLILQIIPIIYLAAIFVGAFAGLLWTSQNSYLIKFSKRKEYGKNAGMFNSVFSLLNFAGVLIAGLLIPFFSYRVTFLIMIAVSLPSLIFFYKIKDSKDEIKFSFKTFKETVSNVKLLRLSTLWFSQSIIAGLVLVMVPLDIISIVGKDFLLLVSLFYIIPFLFSFSLGKFSDKIGRPKMILLSLFVMILSLFIFYVADSFLTLIIGIILITLTFATLRTMSLAFVGDLTTEKNLEYFSSLSWFMYNLGIVTSFFLAFFIRTKITYLICLIISVAVLINLIQYLKEDIKR